MDSKLATNEVTPQPPRGPTVRQGCLLTLGGMALVFFGCLGGSITQSDALFGISFGLGGLIVVVGIVRTFFAYFRERGTHVDPRS